MVYLCQFGQNLAMKLEERVQTRLFPSHIWPWWPRKLGQSPKSNHFLKSFQWCFCHICASFVKIWPLLQKIEHRQCFHRYMTLVTLKTRSRSPVSDHFYHPPDGVSVSSWSKPGHEYRRKKCSQGFFIDINDHVDLENYVMHGHQKLIIF